jgi:hypothetical protein
VIKRGTELCFALEARDVIAIAGNECRKDLQGDITFQS